MPWEYKAFLVQRGIGADEYLVKSSIAVVL
jgi:hypothetical protein